MFIAHLPAGFLLTRYLQKRFVIKEFLALGLIASVFPDIDMLYFSFVDDRQTLHHDYWTHLPIVWIVLGILMTLASLLRKNRALLIGTIVVVGNILLHVVLDTVVGGINWLYPFVDYNLFLVAVPAAFDYWIWSFVFHWTFLLELAVIAMTLIVWRNEHKQKHP